MCNGLADPSANCTATDWRDALRRIGAAHSRLGSRVSQGVCVLFDCVTPSGNFDSTFCLNVSFGARILTLCSPYRPLHHLICRPCRQVLFGICRWSFVRFLPIKGAKWDPIFRVYYAHTDPPEYTDVGKFGFKVEIKFRRGLRTQANCITPLVPKLHNPSIVNRDFDVIVECRDRTGSPWQNSLEPRWWSSKFSKFSASLLSARNRITLDEARRMRRSLPEHSDFKRYPLHVYATN